MDEPRHMPQRMAVAPRNLAELEPLIHAGTPRESSADPEHGLRDRPNARAHVSFGFGVHRCTGNRLADLQLRVLCEEIMKRFLTVDSHEAQFSNSPSVGGREASSFTYLGH